MNLVSKGFDPSKINVYVQPPTLGADNTFKEYGFNLTELDAAHMVVWCGGQDINPALYNEKPHVTVHWSPGRDAVEVKLFKLSEGKFRIGICRGAQLLNVLSGGRLWQHVSGHGRAHEIRDEFTGRRLITSSVHHQMMRAAKDAVLVATSRGISQHKEAMDMTWRRPYGTELPLLNSKEKSRLNHFDLDPEVLWYPKTRSLCFQGHPEFGPNECTEYFFELIARYYGQKDIIKEAA